MLMKYILLVFLLTPNNLLCASAAVHSHTVDTPERESDGAYRPRDYDHYTNAEHNVEFDHEAILGSVKEAEEYDRLSPEESRQRLSLLLPKMDLNADKYIDRTELHKWILISFEKLSREEAQERMSEADDNRDGVVTWAEYIKDSFGVDGEEEIGPEDTGETGMLVREEKAMWLAADMNGDGNLNFEEFKVFSSPEEHPVMHAFIINQALREKDSDEDGVVDFHEYVGARGAHQDKAWLISERDKFDHELDLNGDGVLDTTELRRWLVPDNEDIAQEEVEHLFAAADDDHDDLLSYAEVLEHHLVFVGSEAAADAGRFDDEL